MTQTIVIADYDYGDVDIERGIVEAAGLNLIAAQCKSEEDLIAVGKGAVAVITQYARVGAQVIRQLPSLTHIARYGTGVDIVDVDAATAAGVLVTNVPAAYCDAEVADHAVAMLLHFNRKLRAYDRATHAGQWQWQSAAPVHRLAACTVGIVGLGHIGRQIARRVAAFGPTVCAYDPYMNPADVPAGVSLVDFEKFLASCDYILIQAPLTEGTRDLFDASVISKMKPGSVLINTSRGPIVNEAALIDALKSGQLAAAGLDDLAEEPAKLRHWRPDSPLFAFDQCLITPHVAYYSEESIAYARQFAAEEVVRVRLGQPPQSPVNVPIKE